MHLTRQRISKLLYSCTSAYCACSEQSRLPWCGGEHPVPQTASPPVLAVSSSQSQILHCKDIKETDRRIQIHRPSVRLTGHIYCAESANTTRLSLILVLQRGLGTGPSLAACTEESSSSVFRASAQASVVVPHRRERFPPRN